MVSNIPLMMSIKKKYVFQISVGHRELSINTTNGPGTKMKDCEMGLKSYKEHFSIESILFTFISIESSQQYWKQVQTSFLKYSFSLWFYSKL